MHDIWLDTAITPLEVISVSTPQNNDDACPGSQIYMCKYNTNHNMYKRSNTLKMPEQIWTEPHGKTGRRRYSGHTYIYIGKWDKPTKLSRVPTDIQDACCPVSYNTSLKYVFSSLLPNNSLMCVLIHFKLTFLYFSKIFFFWVGLLTPHTHTHSHTQKSV